MPLALRRLVTWLFMFCAGVACWSVGVSQASASPLQPGSSPLLGALVVPGVESLDGGQQQVAALEAGRLSPQAVVAREVSRTRFERESAAQAAATVREVFPALVGDPAGGLHPPAGARVVGFLSNTAARLELPGHKHAVVESSVPLAREVAPGRRVPIDLSLRQVGGVFEPMVSDVGVSIPSDLAAGVRLSDSGVSLTPVGVSGAPLGGSPGRLEGAGVFYANTQTDMDTLVRPASAGVETDAILRSVASPQTLAFRLGVPAGAQVVRQSSSGVVEVRLGARVLAMVLPPVAVDAEGTPVPVSTRLSGDTLFLTVADHGTAYRYPIDVDPYTVDSTFILRKEPPTEPANWGFITTNKEIFYTGGQDSEIHISAKKTYKTEEYAAFVYTTQGASHIWEFEANWWVLAEKSPPIRTYLALRSPRSGIEGEFTLSKKGEEGHATSGVCPQVKGKCEFEKEPVTEADENNTAYFEASVLETGETTEHYESLFTEPGVYISQEKAPSAHFDTTDKTISGHPNPLYPGTWTPFDRTSSNQFALDAYDPGLGLDYVQARTTGWSHSEERTAADGCAGQQCEECHEAECPANEVGGKKVKGEPYIFTAQVNGEVPEGEDTLKATVKDPAELEGQTTATIKVDNLPPTITISGLPTQFTEPEARVKVTLKDGTTIKSSGVKTGRVTIDGRELTPALGSCPEGPCSVSGEYTLVAANLGAGQHTFKVEAEDNAGNQETASDTFYVHHATPVPVGPGAVDPQSGEAHLSSTDVSVAGPSASLTVQRGYRSDGLTAGAQGPLGPQWTLSVGGQESITTLPNGNATLTAADGGQTTFTAAGEGKYTSPNGDASLALSEAKNSKGERNEYLLRDPASGLTTTFTSPTGPTGTLWKPTKQEGPLPAQKVQYIYQTVEGVTEPKYALAPEPAGLSISCIAKLEKAEKLEKGCRALEFKYASSTTATGEKESEWKEYKGRLNEIVLIAYNPETKGMETPEAQYAYDSKGRLRAEWKPKISPNLKTTYGYDAEGHVTAVTSPAQQPWLLHYGTVAKTAGGDYLLSMIRPSAATKREPKIGPPEKTVAPTLSSSKPAVGTKISVSTNGTWNNTPLAYDYQWQRCNSTGGECAAIIGAVNQSYYPVDADEGHTLVAQVTALNANGATSAVSVATSVVASGTEDTPAPEPPSPGTSAVTTIDYGVPLEGVASEKPLGSEKPIMTSGETEKWGQTKDNPVEATAIFPPDTPMGWPADAYKRATVLYFDSSGRTVNTATPGLGVSTTEYNSLNDVVRTLSPDNRTAALKESCVSKTSRRSAEVSKLLDSESTYEEKGSEPGAELIETLGPQHTIKNWASGEAKEARERTRYHYDEGAPKEGYRLVTTKEEEGTWATGSGLDRVTQYSYAGQNGLGWTLRKPTSVTIDPGSPPELNLTHNYVYEETTGSLKETTTPTGVKGGSSLNYIRTFGSTGKGEEQFESPVSDAANASGDILVVDSTLARIKEFSSTGAYLAKYGELGSSETEPAFKVPFGIAINQTTNDVFVGDQDNNRIVEFSLSTGKDIRIIGKPGSGAGELKEPDGVALDGKGHLWVADNGANTIEEFSEEGKYIKSVGEKGTSCGDFDSPMSIAISGEDMYVSDTDNSRIERFTEEGKNCTQFGSAGSGNGQFKEPEGVAVGPTGHVYVADKGNARVQEFTATGGFLATYGTKGSGNGQFLAPTGITVLPSGAMYVTDAGTNNRVEEWALTAGAHTTQTTYYSAGEESAITTCRKHPEWANLPCQTQPASQPETGGMPNLPVTTYTYNVRDQPETTTETVEITKTESKTRTKTTTYDAAGRPKTETISSTIGTALPAVTNEYNTESGALEKQTAPIEGKTKTITSIYNSLGELETYTDADENKSTYEYDIDGRIKKTNDGKGTQTYTYNTTSGLPEELVDSSHEGMKFTATYDVEGNMLTEGYPNGMTATYTYNQVGKPTALEYKKTTHCTEKCVWFSDSVIPSIHEQWLEQTSTLSHQNYTYDTAGRLTEVQNTPTGKGCTTRLYAYDEDTNRLSLTTRQPTSEGTCATEGGTIETHLYDSADRLADSGTSYSTFGDITALPAADAGGSELTSTYYTDNQLASQTQNGQTIGYHLDPAGRTRETVETGKTNMDIVSHYAGPGDSPAWTSSSTEWTRNIPGIGGGLAATESSNSLIPVLQLTNLHGDIIATAALSETATALASTADTSEYGVPTTSLPPKYSWLGALDIPTELPSGIINLGVRSYVPQLGRFLQPDPVAGGSANAYGYTYGDPVNTSDPSGAYTISISNAVIEGAAEISSHGQEAYMAEKRAAEEAAARRAAQEAAELAEEMAAAAGGPAAAGEEGLEEGEEEWWEEEGEYEYVSDHHGAKPESEEAHVEPAILYQPLGGEDEQGAGQLYEAKGGPGICQGHCSRAHHIWSHARPEHWEEDCAKGVAGYMLLGTPADAVNPAGDAAGCAVGVLLGKI